MYFCEILIINIITESVKCTKIIPMSHRHGLSISQTNIYFNIYFPRWKNCVNSIINQHTGFILNDLPDFPYADNFEAGTSPNEMSRIILNDLGFIVRNDTNYSKLP